VTVTYQFQPPVLFIECQGLVTTQDFVANRQHIQADAAALASTLLLVDLSGVTRFEMDSQDVWTLAWDRRGQTEATRHVAVVAPSHEGFGLARMYEMARGQGRDLLQVFTGRTLALEWLQPPRLTASV
jgi:hypothetical protein